MLKVMQLQQHLSWKTKTRTCLAWTLKYCLHQGIYFIYINGAATPLVVDVYTHKSKSIATMPNVA